jgi:hypothetical protein
MFYVREPAVRTALAANIAIRAFYTLIEAGDFLLESVAQVDAGILTTPEFNYGVPLLIILVATYTALTPTTDVHVATE